MKKPATSALLEGRNPFRGRNNLAFERICHLLKVDRKDTERRRALLADFDFAITSYRSDQRLEVFANKAQREEFLTSIKKLEIATIDTLGNPIFRWLNSSYDFEFEAIPVKLKKIKNILFEQEHSISKVFNDDKLYSSFDYLLKANLRRIFAVYYIDTSCNARLCTNFPKIPSQANPSGAFISFAKETLNALGIRNARDGEWTEEALEKRLKRR